MSNKRTRLLSFILIVVLSLTSALSVMAQPQENFDVKPIKTEYILVSDDPVSGIQSVIVSIDTKGELSEAELVYRDGSQEVTTEAALVKSHYARFDLAVEQEDVERSLLSLRGICDGVMIQADLSETVEGEAFEVELEEENVQDAQVLPEAYQDYVLDGSKGILAEDVADAVGAVFVQQAAAEEGGLRGAPNKKYIVVLDPGHGGTDSGTVYKYDNVLYQEKEIVLKIAKYTKAELEKAGNYTVYMTRTEDSQYLKLPERVDYAVSKNADLLVSLHINAAGTGGEQTAAHGVTILVPRTGRYNSDVAENSQGVAQEILDELVALGLYDRGFLFRDSANGTKYPDGSVADYYSIVYNSLLKGISGIIVEHAFLNNEKDFRDYLSSDAKLKALGQANARGIIQFFENYEKVYVWDWKKIDGKWYYINQYGDKKAGWLSEKGQWYYMDEDGVMQTGLKKISGQLYYFHTNGAMLTGWIQINGSWYYFGSDGAAYTDQWYDGYYLGKDGIWIENYQGNDDSGSDDTDNDDTGNDDTGNDDTGNDNTGNDDAAGDQDPAKYTGWKLEDGNWFYYINDRKQTGWQCVKEKWYYMDRNGVMQTGWELVKGTWYYLDNDGAMQTGWINVGGVWYYLNKDGMMQIGWLEWKGVWYYLDSSGAMRTGWIYHGKNWYYLDAKGAMQTDWLKIGAVWYYFYDDGKMAANTTIDGYKIAADGAWIP